MKYLILFILFCSTAMAQPYVEEYKARKAAQAAEQQPAKKVTTTSGYVDGKYVNLETVETATTKKTTGWVDGKRVTLTEKKKD